MILARSCDHNITQEELAELAKLLVAAGLMEEGESIEVRECRIRPEPWQAVAAMTMSRLTLPDFFEVEEGNTRRTSVPQPLDLVQLLQSKHSSIPILIRQAGQYRLVNRKAKLSTRILGHCPTRSQARKK